MKSVPLFLTIYQEASLATLVTGAGTLILGSYAIKKDYTVN